MRGGPRSGVVSAAHHFGEAGPERQVSIQAAQFFFLRHECNQTRGFLSWIGTQVDSFCGLAEFTHESSIADSWGLRWRGFWTAAGPFVPIIFDPHP